MINRMLFSLMVLLACMPAGAATQSPAQPVNSSASAQKRTSLQWTEMKGKRTQIFIDLRTKGQSTYRGIADGFVPTFMVQLPGDGSVDLLEYQGSGDDWKWTSVPAHIALTHPSTNVNRVEFDYAPLSPGKDLAVVFRSLDEDWKPVASSKVLPWHPN